MFLVSRAASDILVLTTSIVLQMRPLALCGAVCGLPSILGGQLHSIREASSRPFHAFVVSAEWKMSCHAILPQKIPEEEKV